jgi:hypothetical protein
MKQQKAGWIMGRFIICIFAGYNYNQQREYSEIGKASSTNLREEYARLWRKALRKENKRKLHMAA